MNFEYDIWNPWTSNSVGVNFKSVTKSIGDGELKLGSEFGIKPLGQNFAYDLNLFGEKWEVKKLDSDNSFRLGVEISTDYTKIITSVIRIFESCLSIKSQILDSEMGNFLRSIIGRIESVNGRCSVGLLEGLRKNEVAESNLHVANEVIEDLKGIIVTDGNIDLFSSIDGKYKTYPIMVAYRKIILENLDLERNVKLIGDKDIYNRVLISNLIIDEIKIFHNNTLSTSLNQIVRGVFQNTKLVLVHEVLGFKPLSDLNLIYCNRITSGSPRCKVKAI